MRKNRFLKLSVAILLSGGIPAAFAQQMQIPANSIFSNSGRKNTSEKDSSKVQPAQASDTEKSEDKSFLDRGSSQSSSNGSSTASPSLPRNAPPPQENESAENPQDAQQSPPDDNKNASRKNSIGLRSSGKAALPPKKASAVPDPGQKRVDSILASVNGIPISLSDVLAESAHEEARLCALYKGQELWDQTKAVRKKYLDDIINRKLIYEEFEANPFTIPPQYIEDMIDVLSNEYGVRTRAELDERAKKFGTSMGELREKAKIKVVVEMLVNEQCYKGLLLTPKEVYEYYEQHESDFSTPPSIELEMIMIKKSDGRNKPESVKDIIDEITAEEKKVEQKIFNSLAALYSDGPNAENGGSIGNIEESRLRSEFKDAVKDRPAGAVLGPIDTPESVYFLRIVAKKEFLKLPFDKAEKTIRATLEKRQREAALAKYIAEIREKAVIRYFF